MTAYQPLLRGVALLITLLMASAASAQALGTRLVIHEGHTPRGVRYAFLPQPFENTVTLSFSWWDGFAEARPGQELLGRLGAAWLQAGTERLPEGQFREELRDDQISIGMGTGNRTVGGSMSAPHDKLGLAAERLREVLLTPALSDQALARLRRRHATSFEQARELPGALASSMLIEILAGPSPFVATEAGASLQRWGLRSGSAARRSKRGAMPCWPATTSSSQPQDDLARKPL